MSKNRTRSQHKIFWALIANCFAIAATIPATTIPATTITATTITATTIPATTITGSAAGNSRADESPFYPIAIALNTTVRSFGASDSAIECFETYAPSPGTLVVEAIVSSVALWEVRVTSLPSTFDSFAGVPHDTLLALPNIQVLEVPKAGASRFCIAVQDPQQSLGEYKVFTAFEPHPLNKAEDPEEEEPNPEPFLHQPLQRAEDPEEEEPNPEPFLHQPLQRAEDPEEEEPNPEPFTVSEPLCQTLVEDDFADSFACAAQLLLDGDLKGELQNSWGDDSDVLTFTLHKMQTIEVSTFGPTDTHGALYNHQGQRLAMDDDGGEGKNFRLVRTLVPGRYFLRVEGRDAAEGSYVVSLTELHRH